MRSRPPDLVLAGADVADVRAGVLRRAAVAISGTSINAVGPEDLVTRHARTVIDVSGCIVVPGYIEPHTHFGVASPTEWAGALLRHGTTTAVVDALAFMMAARSDRVADLLARFAALPMKIRWLIRLHPQTFSDREIFDLASLRRLWQQPFAAAVGEVTRWVDVLHGESDLLAKIRAAREDGKPVEGHAPGASFERLAALARAGFTSCHEAISAEEVRDRLRAGLAAMLRHSSIRTDLPELVTAVAEMPEWLDRVMLTVDGAMPLYVEEHGYLDHLMDIALQQGIPPMAALRMVTLNPATYFGFRDTGEVAVGKRADLNVLTDLRHPVPHLVIADGTIVAEDGRLLVPLPAIPIGDALEITPLPHPSAEALTGNSTDAPGLRLVNDVITEVVPSTEVPETALHVALVHSGGTRITHTRLVGFADRLGGLATTFSSGFRDVIAVGHDPGDMAAACSRLAQDGGGIVVVEGGTEIFRLPFEGRVHSMRPWQDVVDANRAFDRLMRARGYRFNDPLFSLLFLSFDSLPWIRLTSRGIWDVRQRRVLYPASPL